MNKICSKCEDVFITIVDGIFSGTEICPTCSNTDYKKEKIIMNVKKSDLVDRVFKVIKKDIEYDTEAIIELLCFVPNKYLIGYLDESEWEDYKELND